MRAVPVIPNSAVRAHNRHAVQNNGYYQVPRKEFEKKKKEQRYNKNRQRHTEKGDPVLFGSKNIDACKSFFPELLFSGYDQLTVHVFPTIRRLMEHGIDKGCFRHSTLL